MSEQFKENFKPEDVAPELDLEVKHEKSLGEISLGGLVYSLEKYNEKFHPGGMMAEAIMETWGEKNEGGIEDRRENALENVLKKHQEDLGRTGLGIEPVKTGMALLGPNGKIEHLEVRINLSNGKQFEDYLDALSESPATEAQAYSLKYIADSLTKQLASQYQLGNPDDERMIQLFGSLDTIIKKYQALDPTGERGLPKSTEELSQYLNIARKKYLKEYLWAQNDGLLREVGERDRFFGPSKWHTDANEDFYRNKWHRAFLIARDIGKNKNAKEFQKELIDRLEAHLEYAKTDLMKQKPTYLNEERSDAFKEIIDNTYEQLEALKKEEK